MLQKLFTIAYKEAGLEILLISSLEVQKIQTDRDMNYVVQYLKCFIIEICESACRNIILMYLSNSLNTS